MTPVRQYKAKHDLQIWINKIERILLFSFIQLPPLPILNQCSQMLAGVFVLLSGYAAG